MTTTEEHPPSPAYAYEHSAETDVPAAAIWDLYADVSTWPQWDRQAEHITRDGPFTAGTTGTMKFTGQDPLPYRLISVDPGREFTDATPVAGLVITVSHRLEPVAPGRLRVTYSARIDGPPEQARQIGPMITHDFPDTMAALIELARSRAASAAPGAGPAR